MENGDTNDQLPARTILNQKADWVIDANSLKNTVTVFQIHDDACALPSLAVIQHRTRIKLTRRSFRRRMKGEGTNP